MRALRNDGMLGLPFPGHVRMSPSLHFVDPLGYPQNARKKNREANSAGRDPWAPEGFDSSGEFPRQDLNVLRETPAFIRHITPARVLQRKRHTGRAKRGD